MVKFLLKHFAECEKEKLCPKFFIFKQIEKCQNEHYPDSLNSSVFYFSTEK